MNVIKNLRSPDRTRRAGILLHPTSLPESLGNGDIGHEAYRFIEFLNANGFKVWQMLPLGPTHEDKSPYQCLSSHAGNPLLISLDWLNDKGWLNKPEKMKSETDDKYRLRCLVQACDNFHKANNIEWNTKLEIFVSENSYWLEDYALFMAFKSAYEDKPWFKWPADARHRNEETLVYAREQYKKHIQKTNFEQFVFFTQWHEIREYAKRHEVEIFGDMPIFVAHDSADVWAQRDNFLMDMDGNMSVIAGVPPDAFSATGQRWGNPLYDWEYMQSSAFKWWKERFMTQLKLFDLIRIDHFRGLQACWQIPAKAETAINGHWIDVPGNELLEELYNTFEDLPLVAEDLGVITDDVIKLKNAFNLPGMKVLQFAFDGNTANPHLPHHHAVNDVVYTGTHDNDTSLGWAANELNYNKPFFEEYTDIKLSSPRKGVWKLLRLAMSSVSFLCIVPLQDILMVNSTARMNTPGTLGNNWFWRFKWSQVKPDVLNKIKSFITIYQR